MDIAPILSQCSTNVTDVGTASVQYWAITFSCFRDTDIVDAWDGWPWFDLLVTTPPEA